MGAIDEMSLAIGELRSDMRSLMGQVASLSRQIDELQSDDSSRLGFNKAMVLIGGAIGGIAGPLFGWALGFIHFAK